MSDVIIPYRFLLRGGLKSALIATNEIVKDREAEIETDTGMFKLGDGVTHYVDLPYIGIGHFNPAGISDGDQLYWDATAEEWIVGPAGGLPITAAGDLVYGFADSNGAVHAERLPIGTPGQALIVSPGLLPSWGSGGGGGAWGTISGDINDQTDLQAALAERAGAASGIGLQVGTLNTTAVALPVGTESATIVEGNYELTGEWFMWCYPSGSIEVDVWKDVFGTIPVVGDSIFNGSLPAIVGGTFASGTFADSSGGATIQRTNTLLSHINSNTNVKWFKLFLIGDKTT